MENRPVGGRSKTEAAALVQAAGWYARRRFRVGCQSAFRIRHEQLLDKIETELHAGYQRIKVKVKP
jgi:hypothetical protein